MIKSLSPMSAGLFSAAIAQSGSPLGPFVGTDKHPAHYSRYLFICRYLYLYLYLHLYLHLYDMARVVEKSKPVSGPHLGYSRYLCRPPAHPPDNIQQPFVPDCQRHGFHSVLVLPFKLRYCLELEDAINPCFSPDSSGSSIPALSSD